MKKLRVTVDGKAYEVVVEEIETGSHGPQMVGPIAPSTISAPEPSPAPPPVLATGDAVGSPLAGRVVSIDCAVGQVVASGEKLATLEAMKMHTYVYSHKSGTVSAIHVQAGDGVEEGQALLTVS